MVGGSTPQRKLNIFAYDDVIAPRPRSVQSRDTRPIDACLATIYQSTFNKVVIMSATLVETFSSHHHHTHRHRTNKQKLSISLFPPIVPSTPPDDQSTAQVSAGLPSHTQSVHTVSSRSCTSLLSTTAANTTASNSVPEVCLSGISEHG
jgi:hypothetical protein